MRPGVTERLGLGPDDCQARNPRLVYGRMTGWGQDGPLASAVGHDIDYIAISGALWAIGRAGRPPGAAAQPRGRLRRRWDAARLRRHRRPGGGEGVGHGPGGRRRDDRRLGVAHDDGAPFLAAGLSTEARGTNLLDTGAHFYEVYETADGGYLAVGAIEPRFYAALLEGLALDAAALPRQMDRVVVARDEGAVRRAVRG